MVHLHNGILCSREQEGAPTFWDSMDGTGEHYAKWNKPSSEGEIPYDFTYKWNLINKINKEAKYNQRLWNKEQSDSNQRGGGRKITGCNWVVRSRDVYEGHIDKAKGGDFEGGRQGWVGRGGVGRWKWRQLYLNNNKKERRKEKENWHNY